METKLNLKSEMVDELQELIELNIDSAKGLRQAAEAIDHSEMARIFQHVAAARSTHVVELQGYVAVNDEEPADDGSVIGAVHRMWLELRAAINSGDPRVVLIEAERAEDVIKSKYEKLLVHNLDSPVKDLLVRHYSEVKKHHDLIRNMRDAA